MTESSSFARHVAKSFLVSGVGNVVAKGINVVALFLVLRLLEPTELGLASMVLAVFNIVQSVTEMGLGVAIVQAREVSRRQLDSLFWVGLAMSAAIYLAIFAAAPALSWFYDEPLLAPMLRVQSLGVVLFALYLVPRNLMVRDLHFGRLAIADNASLMLSAGAMLTLAYMGYGAWAIIAGEVVNRVGQLILCQSFRPHVPRPRLRWDEVRPMVRFGVYATGSRLLYNFYINADYLVVGKFFGADAVGIYSLAYRIVADPINTLANVTNQVSYPAFARLQGEVERLRRYYYTIVRGNLAFIGLVLVVICVFIEDALLVAGYDQWLPAVPLVQVFGAFGVFRCVSPLAPQLLNAVGKARLNFVYSLVGAVLMPIGFVIAATISLMAVALSWGVVYPLLTLLMFWFGAQVLRQSLWTFTRKSFAGLVVLVPVTALAVATRWLLTDVADLPPLPVAVVGVVVTLAGGMGLGWWRERDTLAIVLSRRKKKPAPRG